MNSLRTERFLNLSKTSLTFFKGLLPKETFTFSVGIDRRAFEVVLFWDSSLSDCPRFTCGLIYLSFDLKYIAVILRQLYTYPFSCLISTDRFCVHASQHFPHSFFQIFVTCYTNIVWWREQIVRHLNRSASVRRNGYSVSIVSEE